MSYQGATALNLQQCPLTCGLATRMTEAGFAKACAARLERIKKLSKLQRADPYVAWCRDCQGQQRPAELEIITLEEMMNDAKAVAQELVFAMPSALKKILLPMSLNEARTCTPKDLVKFWRRPLIKFTGPSACPCCGGVHTLKSAGLCSGCNSDKVLSQKMVGFTLLEHLAYRAISGGSKEGSKVGRHKNIKEISATPAIDPPHSPPASFSVVGAVDCADPKAVGRLIEERDTLETTVEEIRQIVGATEDEHLPKAVRALKDRISTLRALNPAPWQSDHDLSGPLNSIRAILGLASETSPAEIPNHITDLIAGYKQAVAKIAVLTDKARHQRRQTCEDIMGIIGIGNGLMLARTTDDDLEATTTGLIRQSITEGVWRQEAIAGGVPSEQFIVAKWSGVEPGSFAGMIVSVCQEMGEFLLTKNAAYGNSAADPLRVFSKADPVEQINVRIDDKLSQMMRGNSYPGDNDEMNLIGYLLLKRAVIAWQAGSQQAQAAA